MSAILRSVSLIFVVIGIADFALAGPKSTPGLQAKKAKPIPQVLFTVFEEYPDERVLSGPINSVAALSTMLLENDYAVTILTCGESSKKRLDDALNGKAGVEIETANTPQDVVDRIAKWRTRFLDNPISKTPFGFVIFVGHGESRRSGETANDYLLMPNDDSGRGGICIQTLAADFGRTALPVVFIVDMCRLIVSEKVAVNPVEKQSTKPRIGPPSQYDASIEKHKVRTFNKPSNGAIYPVTTYWSSIPENVAHDSGDFISGLAQGLERRGNSFVARVSRLGNQNKPQKFFVSLESPQDLSLFTWIASAETYVREAHDQNSDKWPGLVDPMMICASTRPNYSHIPPAIDILATWNDFAKSGMVTSAQSDGMLINRPKNAPLNECVATAFFKGQSFPWQGNSLLVEAIAESTEKRTRESVGCLIIPGNNKNGTMLFQKWNEHVFHVPFDHPERFVLPLSGDRIQEFTSLAISVPTSDYSLWPEGTSIRITRLALIDNKTGAVVVGVNSPATDSELELLPRLWSIKSLHDASETSVATSFERSSGNTRIWKLNIDSKLSNEHCGRGGSLFRTPYVTPLNSQLRVTLQSVTPIAKENGIHHAEIIIQDSDGNLLVGQLPKSSGSKTLTFDFARSGFPDQLYVMTTNVSEIKIADISIVAKKPPLQPTKR